MWFTITESTIWALINSMLSQNYRLVRTNRRLLIVSSERSSIVRKRGNSSDVCGTRSTRRQPIRKIMEHHRSLLVFSIQNLYSYPYSLCKLRHNVNNTNCIIGLLSMMSVAWFPLEISYHYSIILHNQFLIFVIFFGFFYKNILILLLNFIILVPCSYTVPSIGDKIKKKMIFDKKNKSKINKIK